MIERRGDSPLRQRPKHEEKRLSDEQESLSERTLEEQLAADLEWHRREVDPRENEETTPPVHERIETNEIATDCRRRTGIPIRRRSLHRMTLRRSGW